MVVQEIVNRCHPLVLPMASKFASNISCWRSGDVPELTNDQPHWQVDTVPTNLVDDNSGKAPLCLDTFLPCVCLVPKGVEGYLLRGVNMHRTAHCPEFAQIGRASCRERVCVTV